jgi:hypothetical protein
MTFFWKKYKRAFPFLVSLLVLALLVIGCGGSANSSTASTAPLSNEKANQSQSGNSITDQSGNNKPSANNNGTTVGKQYLVKALKMTLQVKDTRKAAVEVQQWLAGKNQNITSSGTAYQQYGDNSYSITLNFSVPAASYGDVYIYLRDYTSLNDGSKLSDFTETVQDVTDTYVDVDSRLSNLHKEQGRLQELLTHAQTLGDILSIESKLTEVEGNIESYQAQKNTLTSQVSFYSVTINLNPLTAPVKEPEPTGWSIGQVFQDAITASVTVGQGVLTLLIWLLSFSLYIIPLAALAWFVQRWRHAHALSNLVRPKVALSTDDVANTSTEE